MTDELELKKLWQTSNEKLNDSLVLIRENSNDLAKLKVHNFLSSMKPIKIFSLALGVLWVFITGTVVLNLFIYAFDKVSLFFLFSAAIQVGVTAFSLVVYTYQLIIIYQVDITSPVLKTQKRLASLKISTLWVSRILFLQLPVWTTFYWTESMFVNGGWLFWLIQGTITIFFTFIALWLFINIKYENKDKKWFKLIFDGMEWTPLMNAMEMSEQIGEYEA